MHQKQYYCSFRGKREHQSWRDVKWERNVHPQTDGLLPFIRDVGCWAYGYGGKVLGKCTGKVLSSTANLPPAPSFNFIVLGSIYICDMKNVILPHHKMYHVIIITRKLWIGVLRLIDGIKIWNFLKHGNYSWL